MSRNKIQIFNSQKLWYDLVVDVEHALNITLDKDVESYLVFTLNHYSSYCDISSRIFAVDFLKNCSSKSNNPIIMRDFADNCLLVSGLYPEFAEKKGLNFEYLAGLAQSSYAAAARSLEANSQNTSVYLAIANEYTTLVKVLFAIRCMFSSPLEIYQYQIKFQIYNSCYQEVLDCLYG